MIELKTPSVGDLADMLYRLDKVDEEEILGAADKPPIESLIESVGISNEVYMVMVDGSPEGVFGIAGTYGNDGYPWAFFTERLRSNRSYFLRGSFGVIKRWRREYRFLGGCVLDRNAKSIRFLKFLGFHVSDVFTRPGFNDTVFKEFYQICV